MQNELSVIDVIGLWITVPLFLLVGGGILNSGVREWKQITREKRERKRKP